MKPSGAREAPRTEAELLARARDLAGRTVGELATELGRALPPSTTAGKGFVGALAELALGAHAGSRAEPDFPELGIELKTIPLDSRGRPLESTFVASIPLTDLAQLDFAETAIGRKLARVLFVPVEGRPLPLHARRFGAPLDWRPTQAELRQLEQDYEHLALRIARGELDRLSAHEGEAMQVRPKARRGGDRRLAFDAEGGAGSEQPRGIYLRSRFTAAIVRRLTSPNG